MNHNLLLKQVRGQRGHLEKLRQDRQPASRVCVAAIQGKPARFILAQSLAVGAKAKTTVLEPPEHTLDGKSLSIQIKVLQLDQDGTDPVEDTLV